MLTLSSFRTHLVSLFVDDVLKRLSIESNKVTIWLGKAA